MRMAGPCPRLSAQQEAVLVRFLLVDDSSLSVAHVLYNAISSSPSLLPIFAESELVAVCRRPRGVNGFTNMPTVADFRCRVLE